MIQTCRGTNLRCSRSQLCPSPRSYVSILLVFHHVLKISILVVYLERLRVRNCPARDNIYTRDDLLYRNFDLLAVYRVLSGKRKRYVSSSCRPENVIAHRYIFHFEYSCRFVPPTQAFPDHAPNSPPQFPPEFSFVPLLHLQK